ncbi:RING finger protein 222 [Brienomyrus brachyistius]|uniref:RING finger protein 222 n=1 Tax=Brienomyrus brachyistius TaxID=42636 RepID=UPI0020B2565D|nr:RING finger protein 222 [Brienomyrus brachyistius]
MGLPQGQADEQDYLDIECPVCYELFTGAERTLSCGHVFCHDCLVKTLVIGNGGGSQITRQNIICPVCRHMTFVVKGQPFVETGKTVDDGQTLEVPVIHPSRAASNYFGTQGPTEYGATHPTQSTIGMALQQVRFALSSCSGRQLSNCDSQIFIISNQGRPMSEQDTISTASTIANEQNQLQRRRARICSTPRCLVLLLSLFSLLALVAATLPWVLLG